MVLGCLLAYAAVRGLWNGFFVELASLLSLLIGIWAAIKFSYIVKSILSSHIGWSTDKLQIIAFLLTFILVVVCISVLAKMLTTVVAFAGLGIFNKILGGVAGVLKMALIISVALNVFGKFNVNGMLIDEVTEQKSLFYLPIQKIAAVIYPSISDWYTEISGKPAPI